MRYSVSCSFFFKAEDGIRYLVRSRGLGDVYKRQPLAGPSIPAEVEIDEHLGADSLLWLKAEGANMSVRVPVEGRLPAGTKVHPVSYTHLTLPTSDLV